MLPTARTNRGTKGVGNIVVNGAGMSGMSGIVLSAIGLLVSVSVQGGGGCSKAVVSRPYAPPGKHLSNRVHAHTVDQVLDREPISISAAAPRVNDTGKDGMEITDLPNELVVSILANLTIRDLMVCGHVCKNWQSLVATVPTLACAAYCSCHLAGYVPTLGDTVASYHGSLRQWLNSFSEQGSKAVKRLDAVLGDGGPHFPEQLFFAIARVLDAAQTFHSLSVCTIEHPDSVYGTRFSPDEQYFLSCSNRILHLRRLVGGCRQNVGTFQQSIPVLAVHFSSDSKHLVTLHEDSHAKIWTLTDGQWQQQTDWYPAFVRWCPLFNADTSALVIVCRDDSAHIHRWLDGQWQPQVTNLEHHSVQGARFHPHEPDLLATYCHDAVTLWRSVKGRWQQDGTLLHTHIVSDIHFSPDGNRLLIHTRGPGPSDFTAKISIHLWHRVDGEWRAEPALPPTSSTCVGQFSPRGTYLLVNPGQKPMEIWQRSCGRWQNINLLEPRRFSYSCFSPDERYLATNIRSTRNAIVWKCMDGQLDKEAVIESGGQFRQIGFSPHGNHMVTLSSDGKSARIWGVVAGEWQEKATLLHADELVFARFSPHGSYIVTTTWGNTANIWTLRNKE